MEYAKLGEVLQIVTKFACSTEGILAVGLCGSWARGDAKPTSDIDLSILVGEKLMFKDHNWVNSLDFERINDRLSYFDDKPYGYVWSRHVFLTSGIEIEFGFANRSWANTDPVDAGTIKVVTDGFLIIYDPQLILNRLIKTIADL